MPTTLSGALEVLDDQLRRKGQLAGGERIEIFTIVNQTDSYWHLQANEPALGEFLVYRGGRIEFKDEEGLWDTLS